MEKIRACAFKAFQKTIKALQTAWLFIKKKTLEVVGRIQRIYRNIPVSNRIKISVLLAFGVLLLIIIALLCVPGKGEVAPEGASLQSRYKNGITPSNLSGLGSGAGGMGGLGSGGTGGIGGANSGSVYSMPPGKHTSDALDPSMSVPSVDQPAGGKAGYTPTARERANWEQLLIYLERCESFQFADPDKEKKLAVGAARMAVELYDYLEVNAEQTEFWIQEDKFQNYYYLLSGQYLRGVEMDRITWKEGRYHYTQPDFVSRNVAAEITSVYLLEGGFYRVEGIVTRGREDEAGCYSRAIVMLLTADPLLTHHFYVLSMDNTQAPYTSLYDLQTSSQVASGSDVSSGEGADSSITISSDGSESAAPGSSSVAPASSGEAATSESAAKEQTASDGASAADSAD